MAFTRAAALEYLSRAHERGRLGHAYLISGPPGSGKRGLASDISNLVSGTKSADVFASTPPGVYLAEPESKSRRIVIDQVRTLEHALQMRSANGHRKVAIISDADRLQPQAANAFLKTLEEPPADSLLLLLSSMPEVLPDTILSRCVAVPLAATEKPKVSPEENVLVELLGEVASAEGRGIQPAYQLAESQYVRQRGRLLEVLFLWWSDVLRANTGSARRELPGAKKQTEALASRLKTPEILRRIRRLEEMRDHLGRNIQEALALEVAFLSVFTF
jgi:DNA polymerase-3 subunit delta'